MVEGPHLIKKKSRINKVYLLIVLYKIKIIFTSQKTQNKNENYSRSCMCVCVWNVCINSIFIALWLMEIQEYDLYGFLNSTK